MKAGRLCYPRLFARSARENCSQISRIFYSDYLPAVIRVVCCYLRDPRDLREKRALPDFADLADLVNESGNKVVERGQTSGIFFPNSIQKSKQPKRYPVLVSRFDIVDSQKTVGDFPDLTSVF